VIPGADVNWVDKRDAKRDPQQIRNSARMGSPDSPEVIEKIGGGGWTRTNDLGIMSPSGQIEDEEDKELGSAKSSKVLQNPQQNRNNK
jgi:hypothetical protein